MMMVPWTTLEPAQTETVVGVLLCREHPHAERIRPSRGDGGIDVIEITEGGWIVYQIKYFATNLTANQKKQIEHSYNEVRAFAASQGARIAAWHLVLPLDGTKENRLAWLAELTQDVGFPCHWMGLAQLHGLAAKYPDVIDYFLGNGMERVLDLQQQMLELMGLKQRTDQALATDKPVPLKAADATDGLESLYRALNAHDPFYRYSFSVDDTRRIPQHDPTLVLASQAQKGDGPCVTFRIHVRYAQAVHDHPLNIRWKVSFSEDKPAPPAFHEAMTYGTPLTLSSTEAASFSCTLDLPGGLGGSYSHGKISLGPARHESPTRKVRLQLLDEHNAVIETLILALEPAQTGLSGDGLSVKGRDTSGVLRVQILTLQSTGQTTMRFALAPLDGLAPDEILPALRFAAGLREPHGLRAAALYGPVNAEPTPITAGNDTDELQVLAARELAIAQALSVIQKHTTEQLTMPDLAQMTVAEAEELFNVARLLHEQAISYDWHRAELTLPRDAVPVPVTQGSGPEPYTFHRPLVAKIATRQVDLGWERIDLESAVTEAAEIEEGWLVVCYPGTSQKGISTHVASLPSVVPVEE
ncbi:hypothetical protein [Streptomyces sp. NPDC101237]|uniref:hypothetical protein n=1 Tax=Streptomyces sp. NPDC101237 TaxID=3366139 RepID=UPI003818738F